MRRRNTYSCNVIAVCFKTAHMIQRLHQLEQATTEQLVARRQAAQALIGAQGGITQLSQTFLARTSEWPGDRYSCLREARQVGWQRKSVANLELRSKGSCRSHRSAVVGPHDESGTTVLDNGSMSLESQARLVQLHFILIMLCAGRALDRITNARHGWGVEAWRLHFSKRTPRRTTRGWS